jgi:hypothetical protein
MRRAASLLLGMTFRRLERAELPAERKHLRNARAYGGYILFVKMGRSRGIAFPMCSLTRKGICCGQRATRGTSRSDVHADCRRSTIREWITLGGLTNVGTTSLAEKDR